MTGAVLTDNLFSVFNVGTTFIMHCPEQSLTSCDTLQLWVDNETSMTGMSSLFNRVTATLSGLSNAFFGQTLAQSRLNAMMAYDQSNELFMVNISTDIYPT